MICYRLKEFSYNKNKKLMEFQEKVEAYESLCSHLNEINKILNKFEPQKAQRLRSELNTILNGGDKIKTTLITKILV